MSSEHCSDISDGNEVFCTHETALGSVAGVIKREPGIESSRKNEVGVQRNGGQQRWRRHSQRVRTAVEGSATSRQSGDVSVGECHQPSGCREASLNEDRKIPMRSVGIGIRMVGLSTALGVRERREDEMLCRRAEPPQAVPP